MPPDGAGYTMLNAPDGDHAWASPDLKLATADTLPAPTLPLSIFPGLWQRWLQRAAERAGAPVDYPVCAVLAAIGAAVGNSRWGSPWDGWKHPPIVWIACIGTPSAGKSPGINAAVTPLADMGANLNADWEERQRDHRTGKQAAKEARTFWEAEVKAAVKQGCAPPKESAAAREPDPPNKRRIYSTDPTIEKARDLSAANPRGLLLHRDELAGWVASMGRYGNGDGGGDRSFWLQAFEGSRWASDRVKDGDDAPDVPHLTWTIVGGFQPDRLSSVLLSGDDDGLAARFLYCWPALLPGVSERPSDTALPFDLADKLGRLWELSMPDNEPLTLPFTEEAAESMQDWRRETKAMEDGASGLFLSWVGKLPGFAVRLSVIFAHMAWVIAPTDTPPPEKITLDDLARAAGFLADYAVPMARRAFGEAALPEAERDARRLARWYLRQPVPRPAVLNARNLRRLGDGPGISTSGRIDAALAELAELGWGRPAGGRAGGSVGRQRSDWLVNPAVREAKP